MALIAYGGVITLAGLALFDRDPVMGGITVFVGVSLAALGHTEVADSEHNQDLSE